MKKALAKSGKFLDEQHQQNDEAVGPIKVVQSREKVEKPKKEKQAQLVQVQCATYYCGEQLTGAPRTGSASPRRINRLGKWPC